MELDPVGDAASSQGRLTMAAVTRVYTIARVAEMLDEDVDWLHEISIAMEPEDGIISVYGIGDEYTVAFTDLGIENLQYEIEAIIECKGRPRP